MATRREVDQRRVALRDDLRLACQNGTLAPNAVLPSVRELSERYQVSVKVVRQALQQLGEEGVLHTVERLGTFVTEGVSASLAAEAKAGQLSEAMMDGLEDPNPAAVATPLLSRPHPIGTLGIITVGQPIGDTMLRDWERAILSAMERTFTEQGGLTRFQSLSPEGSPRHPLRVGIESLMNEGVDALVVVGIYYYRGLSDEFVAAAENERVPMVYVTWEDVQAPVPHVFYDQYYAGYQAAQHLIRMRHQQIIFVTPFEAEWIEQRTSGAREAVRRAGLAPEALRVFASKTRAIDGTYRPREVGAREHKEAGYVAACALFREAWPDFAESPETPCPGIIAPNDQTAYGILEGAVKMGKTVRQDFVLIGFDDEQESRVLGLTTLRPPLEELGVEAARMIQRALKGEKMSAQMRLRSHLIPRASTHAFSSPPPVAGRGGARSSRSTVTPPLELEEEKGTRVLG